MHQKLPSTITRYKVRLKVLQRETEIVADLITEVSIQYYHSLVSITTVFGIETQKYIASAFVDVE